MYFYNESVLYNNNYSSDAIQKCSKFKNGKKLIQKTNNIFYTLSKTNKHFAGHFQLPVVNLDDRKIPRI